MTLVACVCVYTLVHSFPTGNAFFDELEQLLNNASAKEHFPLLSWIVQYLRTAREHGPGTPTRIEPTRARSASATEVDTSLSLAAMEQVSQGKKEMAMRRREKLMAHMSALQKKFLDAHQEELEEVDMAGDEDG